MDTGSPSGSEQQAAQVRVLVTGGAGFVGGNLCVELAGRHPDWEIVALDNLYRRGSELNLPRLDQAGVEFVRGDVRETGDLDAAGPCEALVECSAEPSAMSGYEDTSYPFQTNLVGAYHCLEHARANGAYFVFLSTSRVYPVAPLRELRLEEAETRFELAAEQPIEGASAEGISERFPLEGVRTFYGTTKLAAELLIAEYAEAFGVRGVVDRCGVIAGPWQMGKVDQGVFAWWLLSHHFGRPLSYIGYGGSGKQVRDLLHVLDLVDLVEEQLTEPQRWSGVTANVGGGRDCSLSLLETTAICRELTGNDVPIRSEPAPRPGDVPLYLSDCTRLFTHTSLTPRRGPREIIADVHAWVRENESLVCGALGFEE
jgi:CDP-paratose 2-epimerase